MKTAFYLCVMGAITLIFSKSEQPNLKSELAIQNSEIAIKESNQNIEKLKVYGYTNKTKNRKVTPKHTSRSN